jgi:hypothetical protein
MKNRKIVNSGDDFQAIVANADAGDLISFAPGIHESSSLTENALIYINRLVYIELMAGAELKLSDGALSLDTAGEAVYNQSTWINDFSHRGTLTGHTDQIDFWIEIDGNGTPDTFKWGTNTASGPPMNWTENVGITGGWQILSNGIDIKIDNTTGNVVGDRVIIAFASGQHCGIRVGNGETLVEGVKIFGKGKINLNMTNNVKPSFHHTNQIAAVLFDGLIKRSGVYDIEMHDCHRSFCCYGWHSGTLLEGGGTSGGREYPMEYIDCIGTTTQNNYSKWGAGIELGHPEHRGALKYVRCNYNFADCKSLPIEPNFLLTEYQVIGNMVKTTDKTAGIHCWRKSENGVLTNNSLFGDIPGTLDVVVEGNPPGWDAPANLYKDNNKNLNANIGN